MFQESFHAAVEDLRQEYAELDVTSSAQFPAKPASLGGRYGNVYRGERSRSEGPPTVPVAIKVLRGPDILSRNAEDKLRGLKRLRKEIAVWRHIVHPNVLPLLGVYWIQGYDFPAMISEWQANGNVVEYLDRFGGTPERDLFALKLDLLEGVLEGLVYREPRLVVPAYINDTPPVHKKQVIHCDVKGENVLVSSQRTAILCDFGLSWTGVTTSVTFTRPHWGKGTAAFMAPELFEGNSNECNVASDVWAFGCSVYQEFFAGKDPWAAAGPTDHDAEGRIRRLLSEFHFFDGADDVPSEIWSIVTDCCIFDNTKRPDLDVSVRARLHAVRNYEFPPPPPSPPPEVILEAEWEITCDAFRHYGPDLSASIDIQRIPAAQGGFADVYQGIWKERTTEAAGPGILAVKFDRGLFLSRREEKLRALKRVRCEASIWSRLEHPNILPLIGIFWKDDFAVPALVSPWQENDIITYLQAYYENARITECDLYKRRLDLVTGVIHGLAYLHEKDVVHCDIRPLNVLVSSQGTALLHDFNIAYMISPWSASFDDIGWGMIPYTAPELVSDGAIAFPYARDIWAFGGLLSEIWSGSCPWRDCHKAHILRRLQRGERFDRPTGVSDEIWRIVLLCCTFDPSKRPTAANILQELEAVQ